MFFGGKSRRALDEAEERWPLVPHGVSLSIGGGDPLDEDYLSKLGPLVRRWGAPWWSDHVCYSSVNGHPLHELLPLPFTSEAVEHVCRRVHETQRYVDAPLI